MDDIAAIRGKSVFLTKEAGYGFFAASLNKNGIITARATTLAEEKNVG